MVTKQDIFARIHITHLSWFSLAGHQVPTKAFLSFRLLSWTGEKKRDEGLMGQDKDTRTGRDNHHR